MWDIKSDAMYVSQVVTVGYEQLKEKKKQKFLKMTTEGRIRAKQKRDELNLQREREQQLEEERRL